MASDIFAKIGDIKGESLDDKHKDEIEVLSYSWGVSHAGAIESGGGGGAGKASFHDLSLLRSHRRQGVAQSADGLRVEHAHQGGDRRPSQVGQGAKRAGGIHDRQDERRHHHRRAGTVARAKTDYPENISRQFARFSGIRRRKPTARSTRRVPSEMRHQAPVGGLAPPSDLGVPMASPPSARPALLEPRDMFLSVKDDTHGAINGEARDAGHKDEIEVLGWSWGMQGKPSLAGGSASGRLRMRTQDHQTGRQGVDRTDDRLAQQRGDQKSRPDGPQGRQVSARVPQDHDRAGARRLADVEARRRTATEPRPTKR